MNCECESKFKGIIDNIIKTEHNQFEKSLKLHYKCEPDKKCIMNIIRYLNNNTEWKNFKFNQYSVKHSDDNFVITFGYVMPKPIFVK